MIRVVFFVFLCFKQSICAADTEFYGGVPFGSYDFESDDGEIVFDPKAVGFLFGVMPNKYFGVESRLGAGLGSNKVKTDFTGDIEEVSFEIDLYASAYFKTEYKFRYAKVYALAGYSHISLSTESSNQALQGDGSKGGFSYALGVGFVNSDNISFVLEYISLIDSDIYSINGTNLIIQFPF